MKIKYLFLLSVILLFSNVYCQQNPIRAKEIREAVKQGDDINFKNKAGITKLMESVNMSDLKLADFLIKNGANVDIPDTLGFTPLMCASQLGNVEMVNLLLKNNANPKLVDKKNQNALDYAISMKQIKVEVILTTLIKPSKVRWYSIEEAIELNKKEPRKILIDVYTEWCGWCKEMDRTTFVNPVISEYLTDKYYPVKFNAEQAATVIFKGNSYTNATNARSTHQFASFLLKGNMGYPSIVVMDEKMDVIQVIAGYKKPYEMEQLLNFYGTDTYKKIEWSTFVKEFQGKLSQAPQGASIGVRK